MTSERQTASKHYYLCDVETLLNNRYTNGINTRGIWVMPETKSKKKRDSMIDQIGVNVTVTAEDITTSVDKYAMTDVDRAKSLEKQKDMGRPTKYCDNVADEICERIVKGESLYSITSDAHMPSVATVYRWLQKHEDFRELYTRAREDQADTLADQIVAIADQNPETIPVYDKDGQLVEVKVDSALIAYQRNRIDARKWTAAKLKPRKYGERQILAGDAENPVAVKDVTLFDELVKNLELTRQKKKG